MSRLLRSSGAMLAAALLACATGCESVETTVLIGERVDELPADWNGQWHLDDDLFHLHFRGDGVVHAATVEWTGEAFRLVQTQLIATRLDDRMYLHTPTDDPFTEDDNEAEERRPDEPTRYFMLLFEQPEPDVIVLYLSDPQAFRTAVEENRIKGKIERDDSGKPLHTILSDKDSLDALVRSAPSEVLFPRDDPGKLYRVKPMPPDEPTEVDGQGDA